MKYNNTDEVEQSCDIKMQNNKIKYKSLNIRLLQIVFPYRKVCYTHPTISRHSLKLYKNSIKIVNSI